MLDVVSSENREKTLRFVLTFHGQATDKLPTGYRHITNSRPTVSRLSVHCRPTGSLYFGQNLSPVCRPTVGQQTADCRLTDDQLSLSNSLGTVMLNNFCQNFVTVHDKKVRENQRHVCSLS